MSEKVNISRVTAVSLSVINIVFSLVPVLILSEYFDIFSKKTYFRLNFRSLPLDIVSIALGLVFLVYSIIVVVRYFRNKPIKPLWPVVIFMLYVLTWVIPIMTEWGAGKGN